MSDVTEHLRESRLEGDSALKDEVEALRVEKEQLAAELATVRLQQLDHWAQYVVAAELRAELEATRDLVTQIRHTKSWRITKPLRILRGGSRRDP